MTGNTSYYKSLTEVDGCKLTFRNNGNGKICGKGTFENSSLYINEVLDVDALQHILSTSQLCDKGHKVAFEPNFSSVHDKKDNKFLFIVHRK